MRGQDGWTGVRADASGRRPYGGSLYPPGDVWQSRRRTPTLTHATEPESRSSGLTLLGWRQRAGSARRSCSRRPEDPVRREDTASRARRCRARRASESMAVVTEASSRVVRMISVQWRKMRSGSPQSLRSVVGTEPLRELQRTFSPERLAAIQPLFDAAHSRTCAECAAPKRQWLRRRRCREKVRRKFICGNRPFEENTYHVSELGVQQASDG